MKDFYIFHPEYYPLDSLLQKIPEMLPSTKHLETSPSQEQPPAPTFRAPFSRWAFLLSSSSALIAIGTVLLHFVGSVSHIQYLAHWGVSANLFPKDSSWLLINGYYGTALQFLEMLNAIANNWYFLIGTGIISGIYISLLLWQTNTEPRPMFKWEKKIPKWARRLLQQTALTTLLVCASPLALTLLIATMFIPAIFAEFSGKNIAQRHHDIYSKGCENPKADCVDLIKNSSTLARGFVLDMSSTHIAIFDVDSQRSRVLPIENLEIVAMKAKK